MSNPAVVRIALTVGGSSSRFLAENGSIDGAMMTSRSRSTHSGTYSSRENTKASARSM